MDMVRELIILGAALLVFIFLVICLIKCLPRDDRLHRNITPRQNKLLIIVILALIAACAVFFIRRLKESGVGPLFTESDSISEAFAKISEEGNTVYITVSSMGIDVGKTHYGHIGLATPSIMRAIEDGKQFVIIDDYAPYESMSELIDLLRQNGVDISYEDVLVETGH